MWLFQMPEGTLRGILKHGTYWRRSVSVSESSDDSPSALPLDSDDSGLLFPAISLDSIQPKKTVSFNDHINHIIYRYVCCSVNSMTSTFFIPSPSTVRAHGIANTAKIVSFIPDLLYFAVETRLSRAYLKSNCGKNF